VWLYSGGEKEKIQEAVFTGTKKGAEAPFYNN